ncbi:hypothetical protein [Cerasicoccus maritimus]|uniref:hypothetical protein n=1 Tax=Cerasicoccus maritimus TaxID=490089 RepID=UPI0028529162|nr:hypothetical protein [Cerasicoccus maritimus]
MRKFTTAVFLLALTPGIALAHASNDLSHGHAHYLFSWHHFLGLAAFAAIGAGAIWYFTRPEHDHHNDDDDDDRARVRVDDDLPRR